MSSKVIAIIIGIVVAAGLAALVVFDYKSKKTAELAPVINTPPVNQPQNLPPVVPTENPSIPAADEIKVPEATGNIDDAVSAFLQELNNETETMAEEDSDAALITSDSDALGVIGQSTDGIGF